jgi:lipid A 3-O-deacylase
LSGNNWHGAADAATTEKAVGFFLGQNIYTPDQAEDPARRDPEDRVFAGWLYTGMFVQLKNGTTLDHIGINVGVVGPSSQADTVQDGLHELINSDEIIGWDEQLDDEPAADLMWVRKHRHKSGFLAPTEYTDVITDFGGTVGSLHRHAEVGITLRCGVKLPKDFGPGRLELPSSAASVDPDVSRSFYLFTRLSGRAVEYDRFLTGLTHQPFVGRAAVGAVYQRNNFQLTYSQTFMTQEYNQQDTNDCYGALTLTWLF